MNEHIVKAEYDERTGVSTVTKQNRYGEFTAHVRISDDDKDIENRWDGLAFAEYKCDIKVAKEKVKRLNERVTAISAVLDVLEEPRNLDDDRNFARVLAQFDDALRRWRKAAQKVRDMEAGYDDFVFQTLMARRRARHIASEYKKK